MTKIKKILLGGVPFGCDNIGDEAILQCVVAAYRRLFPDASLTVCTGNEEFTREWLKVDTVPLFGFRADAPVARFGELVRDYDLFVWAGATGLSDYPETALSLLDAAQRAGVRTVVWNVGMDNGLNKAFYRAGGRKKMLLTCLTRLSLGSFDAVHWYEERLKQRTRAHLRRTLARCLLVAVRDPQSKAELSRCGFHDAMVGADSAIRLETGKLGEALKAALPEGKRRVGICISSQRPLRDQSQFVALLDRLVAGGDYFIVFIPMNPKTDYQLMSHLREAMKHPECSVLPGDCILPETVQALAASCDVVLSSRLHLLILASNVNTPIEGIARGSKVDNYLANFGRTTAGDVDSWDAEMVYRRLTADHADFAAKCAEVHGELIKRLEKVERCLLELI